METRLAAGARASRDCAGQPADPLFGMKNRHAGSGLAHEVPGQPGRIKLGPIADPPGLAASWQPPQDHKAQSKQFAMQSQLHSRSLMAFGSTRCSDRDGELEGPGEKSPVRQKHGGAAEVINGSDMVQTEG